MYDVLIYASVVSTQFIIINESITNTIVQIIRNFSVCLISSCTYIIISVPTLLYAPKIDPPVYWTSA